MPATFSRTLRSLSQERTPHRGLDFLIATVLVGWALWLVFGKVTVYVMTDTARLEVEAAPHAVVSPVGGRVVETRLVLGAEVQAGDVLVVVDAEAERRACREKQARRAAPGEGLKAQGSEIQAEQEALRVQRQASVAALEAARSKISAAEARARFTDQQAVTFAGLRTRNAVAEEDLRRVRSEAEANRAAVRSLQLALTELEQERFVQESDRKARLAKLQREAVELAGEGAIEEAAIARLEHEIDQRTIRAAVTGRLGEVAPQFRVGSVLRVADKLGTTIPPGEPRAVALFSATAVGRLRPGQACQLRLDGFPWTQYGSLPATVSGVGNEASAGAIRVELVLEREPASPLPVEHGLTASAAVAVEQVSPATLVLRAAGQFLAGKGATAPGASERAEP